AHIHKLDGEDPNSLIERYNANKLSLEAIRGLELTLVQSDAESITVLNVMGELERIDCSKENAREVLDIIKGLDENLRGNSYDLRRDLLKKSEGGIKTYEAYTYGNPEDPNNFASCYAFAKQPQNWLEERRLVQSNLINVGIQEAIAMSERLNEEVPTIYILRGNTAAGKSTALRREPMFQKTLDSTGQPAGAINPDAYKVKIQELEKDEEEPTINSEQCHIESSIINLRATSELMKRHDLSLVMDQRFAGEYSVDDMVDSAEQTGRRVKMLDIESPLEISLIRVLARGIYEPRTTFQAVADGYEGIRLHRKNVVDLVKSNSNIKYYLLYDANEQGDVVGLAEKIDGELMIKPNQQIRFDELTLFQNEKDVELLIEQLKVTRITQEYIAKAIKEFELQPHQITALENSIGLTFKEALDKKSKSIK
ncbi:MAG: zeta toxin family protein, partial [Candidatus Falkowbacteria bacterium]|nr:zeta toxin family protein [Candidatus Falkowbacteria bacterium]